MRRINLEKLLFRYSNALERGDFDAIAQILQIANGDAALERMILEINKAYMAEQIHSQPHPNGKVKEQKFMSAYTIVRPKIAPRLPLTLALTIFIAVVFSGILIFNVSKGTLLPSVALQTSEQDNVAIFLRWNEEVWNQGNLDVLNELITPDHVRHDTGMPDIVGVEAIAQFVTGFRLAVPDFQCTIDYVVGVGDDVWAQTTCTGTQTGDLYMPDGSVLPPSDADFTMVTMARGRFVDGKIAELWVQYDNLGWMSEIGLIPPVPELMAETLNSAAARALIDGAWNGNNPDIIDTVYAPNVTVHFPTSYPTTITTLTISNWRTTFDMLYGAFPDLQTTIVSLTAQEDRVIVHYTAQGTLEGVLTTPSGLTMQPTGEHQEWEGVFIYRFENGLIVEEWWYWNNRYNARTEYGQQS